MTTSPKKDYTVFDVPEVLQVLFHPRVASGGPDSSESRDMIFQMDDRVHIGARFHDVDKKGPILLFFHGNGEIASDYDDLSSMYTRMGINFLVFDYRGYGRSTGSPTMSHMMSDCRILFDKAVKTLRDKGFVGRIILMGRSLGSASALEIAWACPGCYDALIIESGFAYIMPLLELLGLYRTVPGINEKAGPENQKKISSVTVPTLVIHAQYDHIIPFSDGQTLFDSSGASDKSLLEIKGADHNTIFYLGLEEYMKAILDLSHKVR